MDQRISIVTLGVSDLGRAVAFYEALGWVRKDRSATEIAFFQAGGAVLALYPLEKLAADAFGADPAPEGGAEKDRPEACGQSEDHALGRVTLAQNQRDKAAVDRVLAEAEAAGGRLVKPAEEVFWGGYSGYFADPDGHLWEIAWNPFFPLGPDGAITLPD